MNITIINYRPEEWEWDRSDRQHNRTCEAELVIEHFTESELDSAAARYAYLEIQCPDHKLTILFNGLDRAGGHDEFYDESSEYSRFDERWAAALAPAHKLEFDAKQKRQAELRSRLADEALAEANRIAAAQRAEDIRQLAALQKRLGLSS